MSSPKPSYVTPGEYLALEREAETRSEYIAGRMFARSGANRRHSLIAGGCECRGQAKLGFAGTPRPWHRSSHWRVIAKIVKLLVPQDYLNIPHPRPRAQGIRVTGERLEDS